MSRTQIHWVCPQEGNQDGECMCGEQGRLVCMSREEELG